MINGSSIMPKRVRWLWAPGDDGHGRIPMGELTLIVGRGGVGKSTLLCTQAAWITTGTMHGEFHGTPKRVLYVANEDSLEYTVIPRLMAAGADISLIDFVTVSLIDGQNSKVILPRDCERIGEYAKESDAVAIMLDPLASNLAVENTSSQVQMRTAIEAIRRMCESYNMAAIGLAHTRKAASANLMDALMGSAELGNVCRSAMGVIIDPDEEEKTVILSQEKSNLGRTDLDSYKYRIVSWSMQFGEDLVGSGKLEWAGKTELKASDILADQVSQTTGAGECAKWLVEYLSRMGPSNRKDLVKEARAEGYNEQTLKRAADRAKIDKVRTTGFPSQTIWRLKSSRLT